MPIQTDGEKKQRLKVFLFHMAGDIAVMNTILSRIACRPNHIMVAEGMVAEDFQVFP
jgi:hypothetical protein